MGGWGVGCLTREAQMDLSLRHIWLLPKVHNKKSFYVLSLAAALHQIPYITV